MTDDSSLFLLIFTYSWILTVNAFLEFSLIAETFQMKIIQLLRFQYKEINRIVVWNCLDLPVYPSFFSLCYRECSIKYRNIIKYIFIILNYDFYEASLHKLGYCEWRAKLYLLIHNIQLSEQCMLNCDFCRHNICMMNPVELRMVSWLANELRITLFLYFLSKLDVFQLLEKDDELQSL